HTVVHNLRIIPRAQLVKGVLLHERQNEVPERRHVAVGTVGAEDLPVGTGTVPLLQPGVRQFRVGVVVVVEGQPDLLKVVLATHAGGRLADLLHGGQQQADQNGDDGDHHQQLDQREGTPACVNGNHGSSFERVQ